MSELIYIIAGEPSGDALGASLIKALQIESPNLRFAGVGGEKMQREGFSSLFPMHEIALMGFAEILPHIPRLLRRVSQTVADIKTQQPALVVTIDSPGFNFRVAKKLRKQLPDIRLVHYVAPTVWAYKPQRAKKIAAIYDHLLVLLPFEPPYFEKEGLRTSFIGHPIVENHRLNVWERASLRSKFREQRGIGEKTPLLCLLPGSRAGEITRHLPIYRKTLALLKADFPTLSTVMPVPSWHVERVTDATRDWPCPLHILVGDEEKQAAFAAADMALTKSGTISLELAMARLPMITTHRINALSAWLLRRMLLIDRYNLINILLGHDAVPEHMQEQCSPPVLHKAST